MRSSLRLILVLAIVAILAAARPADAAESNEIRIARQPGLVYLQVIIMEEKKLVEKHAAALGLKDIKVSYSIITSGGVMTEAILSDTIDIATTGVSNMLLAWGKTGNIKTITGMAGIPFKMLTRNPNVKSIKDFGPDDRIAVPTIRVSMQAMVMGMALEKALGPGQHGKLDSNQVQIGHPDAAQAMLSPQHEINSHFSTPPYDVLELKSPLVHTVLDSTEVLGGAATISNCWGKQSFVDANPIKVKAFIAAVDEASDFVNNDPKAAAELYLAVTKEKLTVEELVAIIKQPGSVFSATPLRTMLWADYMYRIGLIKRKPQSWKDFTFPLIYDRQGS
ncbi:MAG: ABC transporter substrate-binding protein [Alphaproteobacteria bacterium]|nr:ABC transporter substrate-binding protein [Alphaproteobacteria bacterium]